jgi:anti-anti-sigma factor
LSSTVTIEVWREESHLLSLQFDHLPVTIGALPHNDVVLDDPFVSGEHAILSLSRDGLLLTDRSRNGCWVGARRVSVEWLGMGATVAIPPFQLRVALQFVDEVRMTRMMSLGMGHKVPGAPHDAPRERTGVPPQNTAPRRTQAVSAAFPGPSEIQIDTTARDMSASGPRAAPPNPLPSRTRAATSPAVGETTRLDRSWMPTLRVVKGPDGLLDRAFPLDKASVQIGRDPSSAVRLDLTSVSRHHASLTRVGDDSWLLKDLESTNGTFVNQERITERVIRMDDQFSLGRVLILRVEHAKPSCPVGGTPDVPESIILPFRITFRRGGRNGAVLVADLEGRIDVASYQLVSEKLAGATDAGERYIVLVLSHLFYVDHAGLGVLAQVSSHLAQHGGKLALAGLLPKIRETFALSRLDSLFKNRMFDTEAAAIAYLERTIA